MPSPASRVRLRRERVCSTRARAKAGTRACSRRRSISASTSRSATRSWNYRGLDAVADLAALPFRDGAFAACINIVTLEHVREPKTVVCEIARTLASGGRLLMIVPHEWEVHQAPHDYFRYTRHGAAYLLEQAGFAKIEICPVGGYFRLLSRRMLNGLQLLYRGSALDRFYSGGAAAGTAGAGASLARLPRPGQELHARIHLHGGKS